MRVGDLYSVTPGARPSSLKQSGRKLILVTGRELTDLKQVFS
jgi:hypothetical protein